MLKFLFCLRTFTEFHSHFHAFILTKQTIINTDCGEGMHFSALVEQSSATYHLLFTHQDIIVREEGERILFLRQINFIKIKFIFKCKLIFLKIMGFLSVIFTIVGLVKFIQKMLNMNRK